MASRNLAIALLMFCLMLFAVNGWFANPWTDDYYYSFLAKDRGLIDAFSYYYTHFNGRYLSILLLLINPLALGLFWGYQLIPLVIILMLFFSLLALFSTITGNALSRRAKFIFASSFLLVYFDQMPDIRPGLYWMSGSITYQVAIILLLVFSTLIIRIRQTPAARHNLLKWWGIVLALCLPGTNEITLALLLPSLAALACYDLFKQGKISPFLLVALISAAIGAGFALFTPSNLLRMANYEGSRNTIATTLKAFEATLSSVPVWVTSPQVLILSVVVIWAICNNAELRGRIGRKSPAIAIGLFLFIIFGAYFIPFWGMGLHPPRRVLNMIYLLCLVGWLANLAILAAHLQPRIMKVAQLIPKKLCLSAFIIFAVTVGSLGHSNLMLVGRDLFTGNSYRFDQELQQRYTAILKNPLPQISVPMLRNTPKSLFFSDLHFSDTGWVNRSYADYFGKEAIRLQRPRVDKAPQMSE